MIYLFTGGDETKARQKAFEWVAKARTKEPQLTYLRLAREELSLGALEEAASAGTLFAKRLLVLIDDPFPKRRAKEEEESEDGEEESASLLEESLERLAKSENVIVLLAPNLVFSKLKKIGAKAAKTYQFDERTRSETPRGFNSALVNALAARDGAKLWLEVERSLRAGDAPEQLHGLLHWKARDLMQKGGRVWSEKESRELSLELIELLMAARRKGLDLSESLERFALSI
ncbi:MAG: hypothetical protein ACREGR_02285 [Minisyncoccia bacterium]